MQPWVIPGERYYYGWYAGADRQDLPHNRPDSAIKAEIVERLRENPQTAHHTIRVDVKQAVVILQGDVSTRLAKRSAGDDCWDTLGVADVSNQLSVDGDADQTATTAKDLMTPDPVRLRSTEPIRAAAAAMAHASIGDVIVVDDDDRPIGLVTDRDLVVFGLAAGKDDSTPLSELLGPSLRSVGPNASIDEVIGLMHRDAIRRVPVIEDGHLLGVITLGDLAKRRDPGSLLAAISASEPNRG